MKNILLFFLLLVSLNSVGQLTHTVRIGLGSGSSGGSGSGGSGGVKQSHTSGATVTAANTTTWLAVNPASTLASLTITLAAAPADMQVIELSFGGTVTTGTVVTSLSVVANTGQALLQPLTPTTIEAGETIRYRFNASNSKWYRL